MLYARAATDLGAALQLKRRALVIHAQALELAGGRDATTASELNGWVSGLKGEPVLEHIDYIKNVGLFTDCAHDPGAEFQELTLIFGENGVGKTTIAAILHSLRERNPATITCRRSLPGHATPTCGVSLDGTTYTFDGLDWDAQPAYDTIDVFFPDFVSRNVHAGGGVATEHKRNLCEFVLGRSAVADVYSLSAADAEARAALAERKQVEARLSLLIKAPDDLKSFLKLEEDPEIEERIRAARAALAEAVAAEKVVARAVPSRVDFVAPSRERVDEILGLTDTSISTDAAEIVRNHVNSILGDGGENWLDYGTRHIVDNRCPYCGQDVRGVELVASIGQYFSAAYRDLAKRVTEGIAATHAACSIAAFEKAKAAIGAQVAVAAQWMEQYALDTETVEEHLASAEASWAKGVEHLEVVLSAKQATPLDALPADGVDAAFASFDASVARIDSINTMLAACAAAAETHKKAVASADKAKLEGEVNRLENQKARHSEPVLGLLQELEHQTKRRKDADDEKDRLKAAIDAKANEMAGKYESGINHYLKHFGCDLRIGKVEPGYLGGKASVSYKLSVRGHDVPLGVVSDAPCFDNVLSEGDKYSLALAFFLARLKDVPDLTGRVIVLDDPVNSLGGSRRRLVEGVIRDIRKRGAQVVVLTHDERLAAMLWRDSTKIGAMKKIVPLQVERTATDSRLVPWDAERATRSEYVEDYLTLAGFLDGNVDHGIAAGCIRPYVEQRLRHLYPGPPFETRDSLGDMIRKIREAQAGDRLFELQAKLPELEAIGDAGLPAAHATDDVPAMPPLSREEVRVFAEKALDVLS